MQKRVVLVSAAVAALGLAAAVSGFVAEGTKSKAFVGYDGRRCVYRRTPALVFGVAAALLALAALVLATAASGCFGRYANAPPAAERQRATVAKLSIIAWVLVAVAAAMFLYGAALNQGGTRGLMRSRGRRSRYRRNIYYGCAVVQSGIFSAASIMSAAASACAVAAYVYLQRTDEAGIPGQFAAPAVVTMGQPQRSQPYPPPVAYPPYGGYGDKQPAGQA